MKHFIKSLMLAFIILFIYRINSDNNQNLVIEFNNNPSVEIQTMNNGLNEYAKKLNLTFISPDGFCFFGIYNKYKKFFGGICASKYFGVLTIESIWVDEEIRNNGYGKMLIEKVEAWGIEKGCKFCTVHTFKSWPVLNLYKKLDYEVEFEQAIYENNLVGVHLKKNLF